LKIIQRLLVRQHRGLGSQHVDVGINTHFLPGLFELEEALCGIHRPLLLLDLLRQDADFGKGIFHLLECGQHRLTVTWVVMRQKEPTAVCSRLCNTADEDMSRSSCDCLEKRAKQGFRGYPSQPSRSMDQPPIFASN